MICYLLKSIRLFFLLFFAGALSYGDACGQEKTLKSFFSELGIESLANAKAPAFELVTLNRESISLKQYKDRLLILHFWATWCKPCRTEMPELDNLSKKLAGQPIAVLGISIDKKSDGPKISDAIKSMGIHFPIAAAYSGKISDAYWTWGVPVTYLINSDGKILGRLRGPRKWTDSRMLAFLQFALSLRN
ncbi:MAG: TlpA disulfide reductase family protein [bacterium]